MTTFFFNMRSISDLQSALDFAANDRNPAGDIMMPADSVGVYDEAFAAYLKEHALHDMTTCLFAYNDTTKYPAAVASLSVRDAVRAEQMLKILIDNWSARAEICIRSGCNFLLYSVQSLSRIFIAPQYIVCATDRYCFIVFAYLCMLVWRALVAGP